MEDLAQAAFIPENETYERFQQDLFSVMVTEIDPETFEGQIFSFLDGVPSLESSDEARPSISIPDNLFEIFQSEGSNSSASSYRIVYSVYLNDTLFVRREERNDSVGSVIIAATLFQINSTGGARAVRVENLVDPAVTLVFERNPAFENSTNTTCNFWDFSADGECNFSAVMFHVRINALFL